MSYTTILGEVSPTLLGVHRAADIVAATTPPAKTPGALVPSAAPGAPQASVASKLMTFAPSIAGGGVGAYVWKKHRVLGFLAGHALVNNGLEFYRGERKKALCGAAVEGAGIAGALFHKKLPVKFLKKSPVLGYVAGAVAAAAATYFVDGSPVKQQIARLRGR